ncbi:ABC transporter ATP-binding protein [Lactovum odontotermitis]
MTAIEFKNVKKSFGKQTVIDDLSFTIEENTICGFLGLNGAGKTTTFRLLNGLIAADSGEINILDEKVVSGQPNAQIKFLQDVPEFYAYMTAREYLKFICDLNALENAQQKISETLELVGLTDAGKKRIGKFSRGMKQRIGIAANIIAEPKVLLLDEPVSALDPVGRKAVFDLIESLKGRMTILFSTHIIDDVERVSDKIIMIHHGKKILDGSVEEMKEHFKSENLEIDFINVGDLDHFVEKFSDFRPERQKNKLTVKLFSSDLVKLQQQVFNFLSAEQMMVDSVRIARPSLEEIFVTEVNEA